MRWFLHNEDANKCMRANADADYLSLDDRCDHKDYYFLWWSLESRKYDNRYRSAGKANNCLDYSPGAQIELTLQPCSRLEGSPCPDVFVWVSRAQADVDAALDLLLDALGIGEEAFTFRGNIETGFVDLRSEPQT
jgi:hypothetical protein